MMLRSSQLTQLFDSSFLGKADAEAERYSRDLAAANAAQDRMANIEGYYGILHDNSQYLQGDVDRGMGGVRGTPKMNEYGVFESPTDTTRVQVANANVLNTDQAKRFTDYAGAIKTLRDAGVAIPDSYLGQLLTPPTQATPVPVTSGTTPLTPSA